MTDLAPEMTPALTTTAAKILLVEDDVNLLEGIASILEIEGYAVLTAENGVQALHILRNETVMPDLVVSDIMMPYMTGTQLLREVRKESDWVAMPFIFLTAKGERADIQEARLLGVDDYVTKPYDPIDLLIAIKSRLDRHGKINAVHSDALAHMKRDILTILNHEFRTPLTFVVAYADMLNDPNVEKLPDEELSSFLKGISSGADRLRRLIENFIVLVELETGEAAATFAWRKRPLDNLQHILEAARDEVLDRETINHTCDLYVDGDLPTVMGDEDYLKRAFIHLIENAVKFSMPDNPVTIDAYVDDDSAVIVIQDKGRGIPQDELDKVWGSFYQINRELYEDQGAGSGLPTIKRIIALHGGTVTVQSKVNAGTTFTVRLPLLKG